MNCANCGKPSSAYRLSGGNWCPQEKVFLCSACLDKQRACPSCGTRVSILGQMLVFQGAVFFLIFGILGLIFFATALPAMTYNSLPVTSVSQLTPGVQEKVFGTVSPGQASVIQVFNYQDSSGNSVQGRHVEDFWFNDSSGRLLAQMGTNSSSDPTIAGNGIAFTSPGTTDGFQYASGDPIALIGVAHRTGNVTTFSVSAVAPSPSGFTGTSTLSLLLFPGIPAFAALGALVAGIVVNRNRLALHELNLPKWTAKRPKALEGAPPVDEIDWHVNAQLPVLRRNGLVMIALFGAFVALFLIVVVSPIPFSNAVFIGTIAISPVALIFTGVFAAAWTSYARRGVRRIGFSPAGVYFDYARPSLTARPFIAWTDVRELEAPLPTSRTTVKFDLRLGSQVVPYLDPESIGLLRREFESARVPYRDQNAPIRPSVASLQGRGPPAGIADVVWTKNALRPRWFTYAALLLVVQVPAGIALYLFVTRFGLNQGVSLFLLPGIMAATFLASASRAIREVGVSTSGFTLREAKGDRTILWSDIAEMSPASRGLRYKTYTGFAEGIALLDARNVNEIIAGFERARNFDPHPASLLPPPPTAWATNPVHRSAGRLFWLMVLGSAIPIAIGAIGLYLAPNAYGGAFVFPAIFPVIVLVFAMYPGVWYRTSPPRVALGPNALTVDWGSAPVKPSDLTAVRWADIATVVGSQPSGTPRGLPGLRATSLKVRTIAGVERGVGFVSPGIAQQVAVRLTPAQLAEWKPPPTTLR